MTEERSYYLVYTNPVEGREDEYNRWYDEVHIPDLLQIAGGFSSAQRFRIADEQRAGASVSPYGYLCIYEIDGDVEATFAAIDEADRQGRIRKSPALSDMRSSHVWMPLGPNQPSTPLAAARDTAPAGGQNDLKECR
jgi:hypothetical protein